MQVFAGGAAKTPDQRRQPKNSHAICQHSAPRGELESVLANQSPLKKTPSTSIPKVCREKEKSECVRVPVCCVCGRSSPHSVSGYPRRTEPQPQHTGTQVGSRRVVAVSATPGSGFRDTQLRGVRAPGETCNLAAMTQTGLHFAAARRETPCSLKVQATAPAGR